MVKSSSVLLVLSLCSSIALAAPVLAGITPDQKCASAKMKASGKKFAAKAKCYAKALSTTAPVSAECLQLAEEKFADAFSKSDAGDCLHENDAATIEAKIDASLSDIVGDLGCGNGQADGDEECDDGNLIDGDGCSSTCIGPVCGDGIVEGTETCDDGDVASGDGCSSTCSTEANYSCTGQPSACTPTCGLPGISCSINSDCCSNTCIGFAFVCG